MKYFFTLMAVIIVRVTQAQEEVTSTTDYLFTDTAKAIWLIIFTVFILILVARTFRNKPEA